jgi:hypothetical protein
MKLAYFIAAHRNPSQIRRLLQAIYRPEHYYLLHIDKSSPAECHATVDELCQTYSNVHVLPSRYIWWGGFSVVQANLDAMEYMLHLADDWQFFMNLSGQDFPLVSQENLVAYLESWQAANFVEYFDPAAVWGDARRRKRQLGVELPFRKGVFIVPKLQVNTDFLLGDATWYGGSAWVMLNRAACMYLTDKPRTRNYRLFARHRYFPDEFFIPTAIMNSPLRDTVINDNRRQISWDNVSARPKVYTLDDYDELAQSNAFFARKFETTVDAAILDRLEQRLCA